MNYNRINDSVLDSEDDKKKIVLKENDESNNINEK